jgi:hypothetical protein
MRMRATSEGGGGELHMRSDTVRHLQKCVFSHTVHCKREPTDSYTYTGMPQSKLVLLTELATFPYLAWNCSGLFQQCVISNSISNYLCGVYILYQYVIYNIHHHTSGPDHLISEEGEGDGEVAGDAEGDKC